MTDTEIKTNKLCDFIGKKFVDGELNNDSLVQLIELCGGFLNLKTISSYAKENSISYNGAKKFRQKINLFGAKFIIENQ